MDEKSKIVEEKLKNLQREFTPHLGQPVAEKYDQEWKLNLSIHQDFNFNGKTS